MSIEDQIINLRAIYTDEVIEQVLAAAAQSAGVVAIARERLRQMTHEGYLCRHDDQPPGEMAAAGAQYGFNAANCIITACEDHERARPPAGWPWGAKTWKPKTPERDIERGGALLAAEYDSLKRRQACPHCGGTGVTMDWCENLPATLVDCHVCDGSGRVAAPEPYEPGTLPCPQCSGSEERVGQS